MGYFENSSKNRTICVDIPNTLGILNDMNKNKVRGELTKEAIELMRECEDHQTVAVSIYQDLRAIEAWPDDEKRESIANGVASFAEYALGKRWQ